MSTWRHRFRVVVLLLVALSFVLGGVRLGDPMPKSPEMRAVDGDDRPARIAYDAMTQAEAGNYIVDVYVGNGSEQRHLVTVGIDNADHQVRGTLRDQEGDLWNEAYASEAGTWRRDLDTDGSPASPWRPDLPVHVGTLQFQHESAVLRPGASVSVVDRNETTLVLRVDGTDTAFLLAKGVENATGDDSGIHATLTLAVDRGTGVLRWSRFRWSRPEGEDGETREVRVKVQRFDRWGEVDVRRPRGLPYGFQAVLYDLANHCVGCEEGDR